MLISSYIGSVVEWYDFMLYGTAAALVFNRLFFTDLDPAAGTIASFGTMAVGYLARPLGGIVFGHFGDRLGRKKMLVTSILMMGFATVLIGALPTYEQIGIWAPILLVLLRLVQGVAVGGEWGGAVLMTLEHAKKNRRGLWSSVAQMGTPSGLLLSTLVFSLFAALPEEQFLSWGWRVPFLVTVVMIGLGLWMRLGVEESPVFQRAQAAAAAKPGAAEPKLPLVGLLRRNPRQVVLASLIGFGPFFANSILIHFIVSYSVDIGYDKSVTLHGLMVGSLASMVCLPLFAALSDRIGRRPVYLAGALLLAANSFLLFTMVNAQSSGLLILGFAISMGVHAMMYGPMGAFMAELFGPRTRYTGASIGYQVASIAGGFGPMIGGALLEAAGGPPHTLYLSLFMSAMLALTVLAVVIVKETNKTDLASERP
ncbi:MFS transporter [Actinomadura vinacea]|uniref:MFS transporter n=1 Tax=Actinomadura vinacea TaxID=115336 RepID=A0ABP5VU46_9ACTN